MISDLALIFVGGFLGSSHCVGMCGGFALTIGLGAPGVARNLLRQVLYGAGRIFTYGILGSFAGFAGLWFARRSGPLVHTQALLSIAAGLLLVVQGVKSLRLFPRSRLLRNRGPLPCQANSVLGPLLSSPHGSSVFLAGVLNGLLPCGLVYGYLALASSDASLVQGFGTMVAFGLGTLPIMVLTGVGASVLPLAARRKVFAIAAVCVLATGLLAVGRGVHFWNADRSTRCPGCSAGEESFLSSAAKSIFY